MPSKEKPGSEPPRAVLATLGEDQGFDLGVRAMPAVVRTVAASLESFESVIRVTGQMLVASLAADPKLLAQICDRETVAARQHNKSNDLFHGGYLVPGHSPEV